MSSFLRFFASSPAPAPKAVSYTSLSPAQRISQFKFTWLTVQRDGALADRLKREQALVPLVASLGSLLLDEVTRQGRPGSGSSHQGKSCLEYALQRDVFGWLVDLSISQCLGTAGRLQLAISVARFLTGLVKTQDDDFLTHEVVCKAHTRLLRFLGHRRLSDEKAKVREPLTELIFAICHKVRQFPALLAMFFEQEAWLTRSPVQTEKSDKTTRHGDDFLIFFLLIDTMHSEGQAGEFARASLLMLVEASAESQAAQRWTAESELANHLTVALVAGYSDLGFDQVGHTLNQSLLLASSVVSYERSSVETPSSGQVGRVSALQDFITSLAYWQDVLMAAPGDTLKKALLDAYQTLFLQRVLYPSLLSSDAEDAACFSHLASIMQVIRHPDLVDVTLTYLFALDASAQETGKLRHAADFSPVLFTLSDMIMANLKSTLTSMRIANLRLVEALMAHHWHYCVQSLIRTVASPVDHITIGHHRKEMQLLESLIGAMHTEAIANSSQAYSRYLEDDMVRLEAQNITLEALFDNRPVKLQSGRKVPARPFHSLAPTDPLMRALLGLFANWFTNEAALNLSLTGVVHALASCRHRSLAGWLLFAPDDSWLGPAGAIVPDYTMQTQADLEDGNHASLLQQFEETEELLGEGPLSDAGDVEGDASDDERDFAARTPTDCTAQMLPSWTRFPPFLTMLKTLSAQVRHYKSENDHLEDEIAVRRQALKSAEEDGEDVQALLVSEALTDPNSTPPAREGLSESDSLSTPTLSSRLTTPSFLRRLTSRTSLTTINTPPSLSQRSSSSQLDLAKSSPFAQHFSSTRRQVPALHAIDFVALAGGDSPEEDAGTENMGQTTPMKGTQRGVAADANGSPRPVLARQSTNASSAFDPGQLAASLLINNIILFEEFIKELMSIVQARRILFERDACLFRSGD